jgi:FxsC-like protein
MDAERGVRSLSGRHYPYFFLSYAYTPVIADYPEVDQDPWVATFFRDLLKAVRRHASIQPRLINGFMDPRFPPGSDKESLSLALGTAQAFVPLYSAGYLARSQPGREWACFHRRAELAGQAEPVRRIVPVLWAPLADVSETGDVPGLQEALELDSDKPAYIEEGLRALMKIRSYRPSYRAVLDLLARRIVMLAEDSPIEPSEVPDIDKIPSAFTPGPPLAVFAIEIAAPASGSLAADHNPGAYGEIAAEWRPFAGQRTPLAEYARRIVERFDFKAEVSAVTTAQDPLTRRPGIILIDPWFIADESGRSALTSAVENLPRWVLPLLVLDQPDDARTQELARQVREVLGAARALHTDSSRKGAHGVSSLDDFLTVIRVLVAEAEVQYIRYRSGRISVPPSAARPSLRRGLPPDGRSASDSFGGVTPDA